MGIFTLTLTQAQAGKNLYLYPNGDLSTCTEFAAVGDIPNYACVDEDMLTPDGDSTYVWWDGAATGLDLYTVQNHTSELGPINYIQIYARAKSNEVPQHINGIYKILCCPDSTCSHVYRSNNMNLTTGYTTYNSVWTKNPLTDVTWSWSDVDALCIGVECSSPETFTHLSSTFRPNAPGDESDSIAEGDAPEWRCVDEAAADEDVTKCHFNGGYPNYNRWETDLHNIPNHTTEAGTIDGITVFARARKALKPDSVKLWLVLKTGGTEYDYDAGGRPSSYQTLSHEWAINPKTSLAWTWADIDALQVGYGYGAIAGQTHMYVTQNYMIVNYHTNIIPKIHTTQCYAKINYDTVATCDLQSPDWIGTNHSRNVKALNFWNGTREVYDLNRSGKSMVLTGTEAFNGAGAKIICARDIARNGSVVVITGFSLDYFNGSFKIRSFGWNKISEKPEHYKWIMELEDTEL